MVRATRHIRSSTRRRPQQLAAAARGRQVHVVALAVLGALATTGSLRPAEPPSATRRPDESLRTVSFHTQRDSTGAAESRGAADSTAAAEALDARFLAGLRERRLFRLAQTWCLERLADPTLTPRQRAAWVIELSRTAAEQAAQVDAASAEPLWRQADDVLAAYLAESADGSGSLLVRVQQALVALARGSTLVEQATGAPSDATQIDAARTHLRAASRQLDSLAADVAQRQTARSRTAAAGDDLTAAQLGSLARQLDYQRARAWRYRALCYDEAAPERADALAQGAQLVAPLAELSAADPLAWPARLELIACLRQMGRSEEARRHIERYHRAEPPVDVVLRIRAEEIRLALAAGDLATARRVMALGQSREGRGLYEFDAAALDTLLASWRQAREESDEAAAHAWQRQAVDLVAQIEQRHGPLWARHGAARVAELLVVGQAGRAVDLTRAAENFYRAGQLAEAIEAYDRAAEAAHREGDSADRFDAAFRAAAIAYRQQQFSEAQERFRTLAVAQRAHPQAAEAHLMAAQCALESANRSAASDFESYGELLAEHIAFWPQGATADDARLRWGRLLNRQGRWEQAAQRLAEVPPESSHYVAALAALAECYRGQLAARRQDGRPTHDLAVEAAQRFERLAFDAGRSAGPYTEAQRTAALAAAELWLEGARRGYDNAWRLLGPLYTDPQAPSTFRAQAAPLLIVALAGLGRHQEIAPLVEVLSESQVPAVIAMLETLVRLQEASSGEGAADLAAIEVEVAQRLLERTSELSADERRRVASICAAALAAAGRSDEALEAYQALRAQEPRNAEILERYAQLVTDSEGPQLAEAVELWRELESHSRPATPRWFRARLGRALVYHRVGDDDQAAKLIALTEALHPELGGPLLKAQFQQLRGRLRP